MKAIVGGESKGMLGEFIYTHLFRRGQGHHIIWDNPPPAGTKLVNGRDLVTVYKIGVAGMLSVTRKSDGFQYVLFPWELRIPS